MKRINVLMSPRVGIILLWNHVHATVFIECRMLFVLYREYSARGCNLQYCKRNMCREKYVEGVDYNFFRSFVFQKPDLELRPQYIA